MVCIDQDRKQYNLNEKGPLRYECKQYDLAVALRCIALHCPTLPGGECVARLVSGCHNMFVRCLFCGCELKPATRRNG